MRVLLTKTVSWGTVHLGWKGADLWIGKKASTYLEKPMEEIYYKKNSPKQECCQVNFKIALAI